MDCRCKDVMHVMNDMFPESYAEKWDNVGLMVGNPDLKVHRVLVALDVSETVIDEAIQLGAEMIITHHPLLFKPPSHIYTDRGVGYLIHKLNVHNIALYSAHTNMDIAAGGVSHVLANKLGIKDQKILYKVTPLTYFKLAVFVPRGYEQKVLEAMTDAGAGWVGNYSHCTFRSSGVGTFKPLSNANPFIGTVGRIEQVDELKIETIVSHKNLNAVIDAMLKVHPYEEVAYDIYKLENEMGSVGLGIIGNISDIMPLNRYIEHIKERLNVKMVRVVGRLDKIVRRIAVCGGSGGDLVERAADAGADLFITGDVGYHDAQKALENDMAVVDAGHYATERMMIPELAAGLQIRLLDLQYKVEVIVSQNNDDPFAFL